MGLESGLGEALRTDYFLLREEFTAAQLGYPGLVTMELNRGDGSLGTFLGVQAGLAMRSIAMLGSEEQKQRWLPGMARVDLLGAFALTEPDHGSDSVALETTARRDGDTWLIDGKKKWIGNGTVADVVVVWARDAADGQVKGFLVEKGTPGYNARLIEGKGSLRAVWQAEIDLAEMLTAYRVGVAELWVALVATARSLPDVPERDVIELAGTVFAVQNTYSDAALAAYRDESREMLRATERERSALVEVILTGGTAKGTLWEVASMLRLPLDGTFLVIAAETEPGHDPMPRAESALAVLDVRSVWRLDAELSLGVLSLPDRSRNGAALGVLGRHATGRVGASPVFAELHQAGWALELARLALGSNPEASGVAQFRDSPIDLLVAAAPQAALEAARTVLGPLLELPEDELEPLLGTFEAWLRANGSATTAGAELYCHPNTVRYRLRRIEAGTGRSLASPGQVAELVTAVRAWRELPHG